MSDPNTEPPAYGSPDSVAPRQFPSDGPQDLPLRPAATRSTRRSQNLAVGLGGGILALGAIGLVSTLVRAAPDESAKEPVARSQAESYRPPDARALADQAGIPAPAPQEQAPAPQAPAPAPAEQEPAPKPAPAARVKLANLVGKGLATAKDDAKDAGFTDVESHDASSRGRSIWAPTNWKVCTQPSPGSYGIGTVIDLGAVKLGETCPSTDGSEVKQAGATMPNLVGKSLSAAKKSLGSNASVQTRDGTGQGRLVLLTSNWRVCHQNPRPGADFDGVPVDLTVVKYGESC